MKTGNESHQDLRKDGLDLPRRCPLSIARLAPARRSDRRVVDGAKSQWSRRSGGGSASACCRSERRPAHVDTCDVGCLPTVYLRLERRPSANA
jgi:hypothetical protein